MDLYLKAIRVARHAHRSQYRKFPGPDGRLAPYISHPLRVAGVVFEHADEIAGLTPVPIVCLGAAAVLHDVVEDTVLDYAYLREMFPAKVVRNVMILTRGAGVSNDDYFAGFVGEPGATALKLADVLDNLRDSVLAPASFRAKFAAKSARFLEAVTGGTGSPFDCKTMIPLELWNKTVAALGFLRGTVDAPH